MPAEGQLTVAGNVSLTVKLLTNFNFVNFFKKVFFGKAFNFITWTQVLCNFCYIQISAEKLPNKAKTAIFNGLFGLNIFLKPMQFSIISLQVVKPNLSSFMNIKKQLVVVYGLFVEFHEHLKAACCSVWSIKFLLQKSSLYSEGSDSANDTV